MNPRKIARLALLAALAAAMSGCKGRDTGGSSDAGSGDAGSMTLFQRVAAIAIPNCAVAGCHDAVSKTHSMDLSTPAKILANWVNVPGFDHCTGMNTPRVVPGNPAASLVMLKIEGNAVCAQSQRMPLPPRPSLTPQQITVIREWINAGAPGDGLLPPDAGSPDAGGPSDAGVDDGGYPICTASQPCPPGLECTGLTCGSEWVCMAHNDETNSHPCSEEMMKICGCDGTTFEASVTCVDRPFLHAGACDDGFSCTSGMVACGEPEPTCPPGEYPSVQGTCWGPCVPLASCRCLAHWMCPDLARNTCLVDSHRCGPNPNLADAGAP